MSHPLTRILAALLLAPSACMQNLAVKELNRAPIAVAHVSGRDGFEVTIPFNGAPVRVTLDASASRDEDGEVVSYRWLSGTLQDDDAADGGIPGGPTVARWVPSGAPPDWPDDVAQPEITLGEGVYTFVLWVTDDKGKLSEPSAIKITVAPEIDPALQACVATAAPNAPRACAACVCGAGDTCQAAIAATSCDETCWSLLGCISANCTPTDRACIAAMCSSFLGGATGATPVGACITQSCATQCAGG